MTPLVLVLRVVNVLPQVQVTWVSTYSGWMSAFMALSSSRGRRVECARVRLVNRSQPHSLPDVGLVPHNHTSRRRLPTGARQLARRTETTEALPGHLAPDRLPTTQRP